VSVTIYPVLEIHKELKEIYKELMEICKELMEIYKELMEKIVVDSSEWTEQKMRVYFLQSLTNQ
jgi:anaerobic ribonucleoside-triphosphate reductase